MKKLALLLGSLLVVTATQAKEVVVAPVEAEKEVVVVAEPVVEEVAVVEEAAAPTLKVTGLTTGLWHENRSGHRSGSLGDNSLRLYLDFAYGDNWTFQTAVRRYFGSNTNDAYGDEGLFNQSYVKTYIGGTRKLNDQYSLGYTYISEPGIDTHSFAFNFAPTEYLNGYLTYEYGASEGKNEKDTKGSDTHYVEFQPMLSWNGWGVSYYYEGKFAVENDYEYQIQELRLFTPAWTYGNFAVSGEYRGTLSYESKNSVGKDDYDGWNAADRAYGVGKMVKDAFDVNRIYAHTTYKLNESATLFADLGYEFGKWEMNQKGETKDSDMFIIETGLKYKF